MSGKDKMNAEKEIEKILSDDEWTPKLTDKKWVKVTGEKNDYYKYEDIPNLEISVTKAFIRKAEKYLELKKIVGDINNKYEKKENDKNIYKIIKFYDDKTSFVSYTRSSLEHSLKMNVVASLKKSGRSANFDKFENIEKVKGKLMACYKGDISVSELNGIKSIYADEQTVSNNVNIYNVYSNFIDKLMTIDFNSKIKSRKYYVHRIFKKTKDDEQYIFGSFDKFKNKDIDMIKDKYNLNFSKGAIELEILFQTECRLEVEGLIKVDEYISKHKSITKGFNPCYNIIDLKYTQADIQEIKNLVFLVAQRSIMNEIYDDKNNYNKIKGYVACIENIDGKKYIFAGKDMSIKDKLNYLYSIENNHTEKYKKIVDVLRNTEFSKLKITILEKYLEDGELLSRLNFYINRIGTCVDGLNVVDKPKVPSKIFGALMSKKK